MSAATSHQWHAANNGTGKRIWFLARHWSVPLEVRYYTNRRGDLIRFASYQNAQRKADRLNLEAALAAGQDGHR